MEYQQLVVFILALIGAGVTCRRIRAAERTFKIIDMLVVWVLFPAVVFNAIVARRPTIMSPVILACFGLAASAVLATIAVTRSRMSKKTGAVVALNACFMNYGYLGFPLVVFLLGMDGLAVAALYGLVVGMFHLTVGVAFAIGASGEKINPRLVAELLAFPPVFAMIVALVLMVFGIGFPMSVYYTLDQLTIPLLVCMPLIVGYNLQFIDPRRYGRELLITGAVRFVACPLVTYLGTVLIGASDIVVKTTVILSAMPPAMFNIVLAKNFKLDMKLSGAMIFYPTLASLFLVTPLAVSLVF